jgi:peptide-methionine (S)-S-oxide reductase
MGTPGEQIEEKPSQVALDTLSKAYFASGCFWCVEAVFESVRGVEEAVSGYSGGDKQNPTYRQIGTGQTGHSEAVEVYYDATVVSYETLVKVFYGSHDPTTVNGQHPDYGSQYRSMIFYQNDQEKKIAEDFKANLAASGDYDAPIVTEIVALVKFWKAEDYHQDYERLHPNNGYVRNVSVPRLRKFQKKFPELLKEGH